MNGINYEKLHHGVGSKIKMLEMFFFGFPRIPVGLDQFPNLHILCIVNQRFSCISGLDNCSLLEELWICETQIKVTWWSLREVFQRNYCNNIRE